MNFVPSSSAERTRACGFLGYAVGVCRRPRTARVRLAPRSAAHFTEGIYVYSAISRSPAPRRSESAALAVMSPLYLAGQAFRMKACNGSLELCILSVVGVLAAWQISENKLDDGGWKCKFSRVHQKKLVKRRKWEKVSTVTIQRLLLHHRLFPRPRTPAAAWTSASIAASPTKPSFRSWRSKTHRPPRRATVFET